MSVWPMMVVVFGKDSHGDRRGRMAKCALVFVSTTSFVECHSKASVLLYMDVAERPTPRDTLEARLVTCGSSKRPYASARRW